MQSYWREYRCDICGGTLRSSDREVRSRRGREVCVSRGRLLLRDARNPRAYCAPVKFVFAGAPGQPLSEGTWGSSIRAKLPIHIPRMQKHSFEMQEDGGRCA